MVVKGICALSVERRTVRPKVKSRVNVKALCKSRIFFYLFVISVFIRVFLYL